MGILLETSPQRMNLLKGGDINSSTIANNPQDINDQIACKFLRRQIIGRNTLYEGNIRKAPVSPGELIEPGYNGEVSLKSAYKKPLANSLADVERNVVSGESAQITPNEDARLAPNNRSIEVADRQLADNFTGATTNYSVANNSRNVNEDVKYKLNPEHEAQVRAYNEHITRLRQREEYLRGQGMSENAPAMINLRKAQEQAIYARDHIGEVDKLGNVLAYDISGIRKSTGRGLDGSAISADALDQSIDNSSIANNPQNTNDQIACKFLRRQTIGRNTLYEGNVRSQEKSRPGETGRYNTATIADFNGNISLKNISPRREGEIKNLSQQREEISRASDGGANVVPSSTNSDSYVGGAPVSAGRSSDVTNIAQEVQNVNDENDHTTTRKSPMEPAGTSPSTELHHLGDSARNIAQESQNVDGGGNRASAAQLAEYDQNNTCTITLIGVHCSYSPLSKDCINI